LVGWGDPTRNGVVGDHLLLTQRSKAERGMNLDLTFRHTFRLTIHNLIDPIRVYKKRRMLEQLFFYFFAGLMIISSIMVIGSRNPIHSIFFLILVFFNASALLLMLEVEFLAILLLVVYVGAVAVLFLFVVMMLNLHLSILSQNFFYYFPFGGLIGLIFLFELFLILDAELSTNIDPGISHLEWVELFDNFNNIQLFGLVLYTEYAFLLIIASLILLLAMLGAIVLTGSTDSHMGNKKTLNHYKQNISEQVSREAPILMIEK